MTGRTFSTVAIICALAMTLLYGCKTKPDAPDRDAATERAVSDEPWEGPDLSVQVLTQRVGPEDEFSLALIEMVVPTGGHLLHLDHVEVHNQTVHIFLTLEKPGRDEIVTQALETLYAQHRSETPFAQAEVYLRSHHRGEPVPDAYRRATNMVE